MASTITNVSKLIDNNFPTKGQSAIGAGGFNSNFNKIQSSFTILSEEIEQLQSQIVKLNEDNTFGNGIINSAVFKNSAEVVNDLGVVTTGAVEIDYNLGPYHVAGCDSANLVFNITNWPIRNTYAKLRLQIRNNNVSSSSTVFVNFSGKTNYYKLNEKRVTIPPNKSCFFDIWSTDGGENIGVKPLGIVSGVSTSTYLAAPGPSGNLPVISNIEQSSVPSSGGTSVVINGTYFSGFPQVIINGTTPATITASSGTQITFTSISGIAGTFQTIFVRTTIGDSNSKSYYLYDDSPGGP